MWAPFRVPQYILSPCIMLSSSAWVNNSLYTEDKHCFPIALLKGSRFGCLNTGTSSICETLRYPRQLHANGRWSLRKTMSFWSNRWRPGKIPWGMSNNMKHLCYRSWIKSWIADWIGLVSPRFSWLNVNYIAWISSPNSWRREKYLTLRFTPCLLAPLQDKMNLLLD